MKNFSEWSQATDPYFHERKILAFDLDDTLTHHGALDSKIVAYLEKAQSMGWLTVLVTGRSAGWVDALIKLLPFDAIVGENGALLYFWLYTKAKRSPTEEATKLFWSVAGYTSNLPQSYHEKKEALAKQILSEFPKARVASDQAFRIYDLAIDFAEEVTPPLSLTEAQAIYDSCIKKGATTKLSSIHVNAWFGDFSKVEGLSELIEKYFKLTLQKHLIYVGDSPNDAPLFKAAGLSVGVANVRDFIEKKIVFDQPQFITQGRSNEGSLEILTKAIDVSKTWHKT